MNGRLHRVKITFNVTEKIKRFVYVYLIIDKGIYLIDAGVRGSEKTIADYLVSIGRRITEVKGILLTHSHPDHIGGANAIKELSNCIIYACEQEKTWIEDIDVQFKERPIPNFYELLNHSVGVDKIIFDGDALLLEPGITIKVIDTKGHSQGSLSFFWEEENIVFTGDAIPVIGDIPIFVSARDSRESLKRLKRIGADQYLSAWDEGKTGQEGEKTIDGALVFLDQIESAVKNALTQAQSASDEEVYANVCITLNMEHLLENPLFKKSVFATISEMR